MTSATYQANTSRATSPGLQLYWRVSGVALAAVAALGFLLVAMGAPALLGKGFLAFDTTHNLVHLLLAVVALTLGFGGPSPALAKTVAKVIGVVYLGLGVLGFLPAVVGALGDLLHLHLELGENLVHVVLGAWGAYVGFTD